jgi:hypothetical protein
MQALDLYGPVQRLEVLIKRRKGRVADFHASGQALDSPSFRTRSVSPPPTTRSQIAQGRGVAFARWHEPALHDFIAVLTGHLRSSSCY